MSESAVFEWVSSELERRTSLRRIEARGTVRLVLKAAGLEVASVTAVQMEVVLRRLIPRELEARRVLDAESLCSDLADGLTRFADERASDVDESAYDVFRRLGGDDTHDKGRQR